MSEVTALLEGAWKRIEDPKNWRQRNMATTRNGIRVNPENPDAYRFCAVGSIRASAVSPVSDKAEEFLVKSAIEVGERWAEDVNDFLGHDAVRKMYALAIEKSTAEAA